MTMSETSFLLVSDVRNPLEIYKIYDFANYITYKLEE